MGMSSPTTKADAREQIARLQGDIAHLKAQAQKAKAECPKTALIHGQIANEIASKKARIAELRAKIPSLP